MRTKRKAFGTTLPEPLSSDFISFCVKNGYKYAEALREGIRRLLTPSAPQHIYQSTPLPRLNRPPLPPQQMGVKGLLVQELKDVLSQGIELRFKKYDHKPHNDLEIRDQLRIQRIKKEEDLLKEVEIK